MLNYQKKKTIVLSRTVSIARAENNAYSELDSTADNDNRLTDTHQSVFSNFVVG